MFHSVIFNKILLIVDFNYGTLSCNFRLGIQAQDIVDFLIRKEIFLVNLYL